MADWEDAPTTKSSSGWEDAPASKPKAEGDSDLYTKTYKALTEALPEKEGRTQVVGPMLAAGAGELARGVGAATQLVAPETGKKISDVGRAVVEATKSRYPITGTLGQLGSYVYPYKAAETAVTKVLPRTGELGREALIAGGAGGLTGAATSEGDLVDRAFGGALGTTLGIAGTYGAALATKGYQYTKDVLQKAFGGDAKRMANALRDYAARRSGAEAQAAQKMATEAEQKAGIAETAEQKAARQQELAYRELPGTKTEKEAGRFKAVPTSEQAVGDRIRGYVDRVFKDLKAVRARNAEKLKGEAFGDALTKEQAGQKVADTKAYQKLQESVKNELRTPEGLVSAPGSTGSKLQELNNILKGTAVDEATGVVVQNDLSFQGMERLRRQLNDRAYGFPETGFDALSQQDAGKYAKMVSEAMEEFSPKIKTFLNQYKADSEPLRVFQTKTGKIFEEQLPGVKGYAKVSAENIPSKVFKDRESYQGLIEALGGNKAFAENEARKYFAGQMEKLAGDPKKLEAFIRDNRTMLNLTNARDMAESYIARASAFAKRGEAAKTRATAEKDIATKQAGLAKDFAKLESDLVTAQTPQEIAGLHETLAKKFLNEGTINQQQYRTMLQEATRVLQTVKDTAQAKQQLLGLTWRGVGGGALGAATYMGVKRFGE